jgi:hypothetical protein
MPSPALYAKVSTDGQAILAEKIISWPDEEASPVLDRATAISLGKPYWLPVVERGPQPAYDPATQHPPQETETIGQDSVVQGWAAPVDKTPQEIDAEKTERATKSALSDEGRAIKLLFVFGYEIAKNLSKKPNMTVQQYLDYLDGLPTVEDTAFIQKIKGVLE